MTENIKNTFGEQGPWFSVLCAYLLQSLSPVLSRRIIAEVVFFASTCMPGGGGVCQTGITALAQQQVEQQDITQIVSSMGSWGNRDDMEHGFNTFKTNSRLAVACLIDQLRPVHISKVSGGKTDSLDRKGLQMVWSIRALRFLTGGIDFDAPTKYRFGKSEDEKNRKQFLTIHNKANLPFFSVWMSRDIAYIAPEDAQLEIIRKWKKWYELNKNTFRFGPREGETWMKYYF